MDLGRSDQGLPTDIPRPSSSSAVPPMQAGEPEAPPAPTGQHAAAVGLARPPSNGESLLGAQLSSSPSDEHPSSSSTSSSPLSGSFSSTTGLEASESAATSRSPSSSNSDGDYDKSGQGRLPSSFSTATLRAALEAADPAPLKSASLPLAHAPVSRARLQHSASEPIPTASTIHSEPAFIDDERTPVPDSTGAGRAFVFPPPLPTKEQFTRDPVASDIDPFSPTSHSPAPSHSPPSVLSLLTSRPAGFHHRKTHSGAASSGAPPSTIAGIHKRVPSASLKPAAAIARNGGQQTVAEVAELTEAGLRVHDFRPAPGDVTPVLKAALGTKVVEQSSAEGKRSARGLMPAEFVELLEQRGALVVDVRSLSAFLGDEGRVRGSVNVNFPTLLIKRFRKGNSASFSLSSFTTTQAGKSLLEDFQQSPHHDIVVVDDRLETRDPVSLNPGSVLLSVLERRHESGEVYYLNRPLNEAIFLEPRLSRWIVYGEGEDELSGSSGTVSEDDSDSRQSAHGGGLHPIAANNSSSIAPPRLSPLPRTPTNNFGPPSLTPPKTPGDTPRARPPKLRRIDTSENLLGARKHTPSAHRAPSRSPNAPTLRVDAQSANNRNTTSGMSLQAICHMQAKSPAATATRFAEAELTLPPRSAYPQNGDSSSSPSSPEDPRTSVADVPPFVVSSIIPGFLYLGPEPTKPEDLDELEALGVKEVLNLALECEDKDGEIGRRFELKKIGMRDFVEETGVQQAIEEACRILRDAQLQSKPVYVHCRAGKSRSVTIVLAYLVHRNHWSLKRAYAHVSERRKGISPNIGFVAELMTWEERERGRKSQGVYGSSSHRNHSPSSPSSTPPSPPATAPAPTAPPANHITLPPTMARSTSDQGRSGHAHSQSSFAAMRYPDLGGGKHRDSMPASSVSRDGDERNGDGEGEGREKRAADGTWTPARWQEHDEQSNPQRRSSRAGLESYAPTRLGD